MSNKFRVQDGIVLPYGSIIEDTSTTTVITPPNALAGQSLVIRPTGSQGITSDRPLGFTDGDTITLTVTPDYNSTPVTGTVDYTFTGCTSVELGRALTGTLTFTAESAKPISWTIPVSSTMTTFTITLSNASGFDISGISPLTLTTSGSTEDHHIHLIAGDPSTTDIYLGDDDQYIKIERNGGNVLIGTDENNNQWTFGTDGGLTLPGGITFPYNYYVGPGEGSLGISSPDSVAIIANVGMSSNLWLFDTDGNLTLPNSTIIANINNTPAVGQRYSFTTDSVGATPSWDNTNSVIVNKPLGYTSATWSMTLHDTTPITLTSIVDNNDGTLTISFGGATTASAVSVWPILLVSSDYVAEINDGGTGIVTDDGTWVFRNDGNLSISGSVIPSTDNAYDLGTPTKKFRHIYTDNGSIYVGNIKLSNDNGNLSVVSVTNVGEQNESNVAVALKTDRLSSTTGGHEVILGIDSNLTVSGNINTKANGFNFNLSITDISLDGSQVYVDVAENIFDDLTTGVVTISNVTGMTQANGVWGYESISDYRLTLYTTEARTTLVNGSAWSSYISGGTAFSGTYNDLSITVGNKNWGFKANADLVFPDSTTQTTAYRNRPQRNLNIEGGSASTVFEIDMTYVDCGGSYLRGILSQDTYDGSEGDYNPTIDKILDGGQS